MCLDNVVPFHCLSMLYLHVPLYVLPAGIFIILVLAGAFTIILSAGIFIILVLAGVFTIILSAGIFIILVLAGVFVIIIPT